MPSTRYQTGGVLKLKHTIKNTVNCIIWDSLSEILVLSILVFLTGQPKFHYVGNFPWKFPLSIMLALRFLLKIIPV